MKNAKPIIFNPEMAQAIHEGRKTQTRRLAEDLMSVRDSVGKIVGQKSLSYELENGFPTDYSPHKVGDLLWVKENFKVTGYHGGYQSPYVSDDFEEATAVIQFSKGSTTVTLDGDRSEVEQAARAFNRSMKGHWCPSIHMPRWASRTLLKVTGVRLEPLQDITEKDAVAEGLRPKFDTPILTNGIEMKALSSSRDGFKKLWQSVYGNDSWNSNPWVWVYDFEKVEAE